MSDEAFEPYPCSLGMVVGYSGNSYLIESPTQGLIGIPSNTTPSPENVEYDIAHPAAPYVPVPDGVTPLQMRRALNQQGLRAAVEAAVAASPQDAQDAWQYATIVMRDDPVLAAMAAHLGLTSEQVDDLFRLAATFV